MPADTVLTGGGAAAVTASTPPPAAASASGQPQAGAAPGTPTASGDAANPAADAKPAAPVIPEKYDLKLPAGSTLKADALAEQAKAIGLTQEQAQKLADARHQEATAAAAAQAKAIEDQSAQWVSSLRADADIAGADGKIFDSSIAKAQQALKKYGDADFVKELNDSGLGNHPGLVRMLVKIGRAMAEDSAVDSAGQRAQAAPSLAQRLYPNMKPTSE